MKFVSAITVLIFTSQVFANLYYCNGSTIQSGSSWYYPNGSTAQSGSSVYYENGSTLKSGSSLYFKNGSTLKSGSFLYYSNGSTLKSGSSLYHSNGNTLKSGSSCYYENGNSMGSCPSTYRIQAGLGSNDLEINLELKTGEILSMTYGYTVSGQPGYVTLNSDGTVESIQYECATNDSAVDSLIKTYQSLSSDQKSQVKMNICH